MEIRVKKWLGRLTCKHDYQEGVATNRRTGEPVLFNISGETITTICVKCGKVKSSYFRPNVDGS